MKGVETDVSILGTQKFYRETVLANANLVVLETPNIVDSNDGHYYGNNVLYRKQYKYSMKDIKTILTRPNEDWHDLQSIIQIDKIDESIVPTGSTD